MRRRRSRPGDTWPLDEVFLTIQGQRDDLWRAVDQDGNILDILVQHRRDKMAAKKFFRKLLKGLSYVPRVIITDQLPNYEAAKREFRPSVEHQQHRLDASLLVESRDDYDVDLLGPARLDDPWQAQAGGRL